MKDNLLQDITIYHHHNNTWVRYNLKASVRNTFNKNRDNTGSNNVNRALIRIFDVKGYKSKYNIQDGDVIVDKNVYDIIGTSPLTILRANYGKDSVYSVNSVEKFVFDDLELSHIKIGAI